MRRDTERENALEQALRRLYQSEEPPAGFETGWRAAVRREESMMESRKNRRSPVWRAIVPACAALVLVAGSLWAGTLQPQPAGDAAEESAAPYSAKLTTAAGTGRSSSNSAESYAMYDGAELGAAADEAVSYGADGGTEAVSGQKLVRTAGLTIRTTAFDEDVERVRALLESMGGYVESLYQYGDAAGGDLRTMSMSVRVPSENLDAFLGGAEGVGRVTDRSETTTDMTVQYTDNQARLDTLYAKQERLNELIAQAQEVSDLIELEQAIADTQYEIDRYETSQRDIDRRVDMSAVSLTILEEGSAQSAAAQQVGLGDRLRAALDSSITWLGSFFTNMLVFLTMILPVALPVCVVALVVWLIVRRRRARRSKHDLKEE